MTRNSLLLAVLLSLLPSFASLEATSECTGEGSSDLPSGLEGARAECSVKTESGNRTITLYRHLHSGRLVRFATASEASQTCNSGVSGALDVSSLPGAYLNQNDRNKLDGWMLSDELLIGFSQELEDPFLHELDRLLAEISTRNQSLSGHTTEWSSAIWRSGLSRDRKVLAIRFAESDIKTMLTAIEIVPGILLRALEDDELGINIRGDEFKSSDSTRAERQMAIEFVEPNYLLFEASSDVQGLPIQPGDFVGYPWGLVAAHVPRVWTCALNAPAQAQVTPHIALLDTGLHSCHEELLHSLPRCPDAEFSQNDFLAMSDSRGHGTQCAGVIAAQPPGRSHSDLASAGVAPRVKIVPMRTLDSDGWGDVFRAVNALQFLAERNPREKFLIVNASWGMSSRSEGLRRALIGVLETGALIVAAAGNFGDNLGECPFYPASFMKELNQGDHQGAVLAIAGASFWNLSEPVVLYPQGGTCLPSCEGTNWGEGHISLSAPSVDIKTTHSEKPRALKNTNGTSFAAAFVTGAAAWLQTLYPRESARDLAARLQDGACTAPNLTKFWEGGRFIDLEGAMSIQPGKQVSQRICDLEALAKCGRYLCSNAPSDCRIDDLELEQGWFRPLLSPSEPGS